MAASIGSIGWMDLTISDAEANKNFYETVLGVTSQPTDMGGYNDHTLMTAEGVPIGGVCHARGGNAEHPPMWLPYFVVSSIEESIAQATAAGGEVLRAPKSMGGGTFAVLKDPAGACFALWKEDAS